MNKIPFNKPYFTGKETSNIVDAVASGKISGDGMFTQKCHLFFQNTYRFQKCLLTTSCTDALEMAALLINIEPGDEVIMPSYTFVSTANAFVLRGAKIVFCDSRTDHPGLDESLVEELITKRTKAIVVVHYAGVACNMNTIMALGKKYNLFVIEDAAQAIDSYYLDNERKVPLGSIGNLAAFSFHETKNIQCGEGGMLVINDPQFNNRAEIIREKGTNRSAFFRGEVDKYGWVDIGSSFLPSELNAAFLFAQLENLDRIQNRRREIWNQYNSGLAGLVKQGIIKTPFIPEYATNNSHMFYITCKDIDARTRLIEKLKQAGIYAVFHYISLHKSSYYAAKHDGRALPLADHYTDCLLRLPFFYELTDAQVDHIINTIVTGV